MKNCIGKRNNGELEIPGSHVDGHPDGQLLDRGFATHGPWREKYTTIKNGLVWFTLTHLVLEENLACMEY